MSSDAVVTPEFHRRLRAFVRRRVRSDEEAEDIAQEVLLKFVRESDSIDAGRGPAWILAVARREIADLHRRGGPRPAELSGDERARVDEDEPSALVELSHCVQPLLDRLAPADRDLLRRVDLLGESQAELADAQVLPRSTLKARVQRARERFRQELLECCSLALDARGLPSSYARRGPDSCPCAGETPPGEPRVCAEPPPDRSDGEARGG